MPFPTGWPPRVGSGQRNIRFFLIGITSGGFDANAYLFADQAAANTYQPLPVVRPGEDVSKPGYTGPHDIGASPSGTGQNDVGAPHPMIWSERILVVNEGSTPLEISFDGINIHGVIDPTSERVYESRREAGIALRGGGVAAAGFITTVIQANIVDGETFTLDDGINPPVVFEFDKAGDGVTPGNTPVNIVAAVTANDVRDAIISAINGVGALLLMTATDGGAATVTLTQDVGGTHGNTTQTETVANVGFVLTDMTGAGDASFRVEAW